MYTTRESFDVGKLMESYSAHLSDELTPYGGSVRLDSYASGQIAVLKVFHPEVKPVLGEGEIAHVSAGYDKEKIVSIAFYLDRIFTPECSIEFFKKNNINYSNQKNGHGNVVWGQKEYGTAGKLEEILGSIHDTFGSVCKNIINETRSEKARNTMLSWL